MSLDSNSPSVASNESALDGVIREWLLLQDFGDPNALGEILRAWAFPGDGYGCYSNFDVHPEFVPSEVTPREFEFIMGRAYMPNSEYGSLDGDENIIRDFKWFKHPNGIEMGWFWDGDGTLAFFVPELSTVVRNGDCKKNYGWESDETPLERESGESTPEDTTSR